MVAICDISEYRSCIKEFKVIKNIRTVVLACWLFSPHLFSLLKWNRMNKGQFNYLVSERTQWQLVLNFNALISGHYSVPSLPHPIEWMFLGRIVVQTCYIALCILVRLCVPRVSAGVNVMMFDSSCIKWCMDGYSRGGFIKVQVWTKKTWTKLWGCVQSYWTYLKLYINPVLISFNWCRFLQPSPV